MPDRDNLKEYIMKTDALILDLGITDVKAELEKEQSKYRFLENIFYRKYLSTNVYYQPRQSDLSRDTRPPKMRHKQLEMLNSAVNMGWVRYSPSEVNRVMSLVERRLVRTNEKNQFKLTGKEW